MGPQLGPLDTILGGRQVTLGPGLWHTTESVTGRRSPVTVGWRSPLAPSPHPFRPQGWGGDNKGVLLLAPELEPTTVCCVCPLSVRGPLLNFPHAVHCVLGCFPPVDSESPLSESLDKLTKTFSSNTSRLGCNFWGRNRTTQVVQKWLVPQPRFPAKQPQLWDAVSLTWVPQSGGPSALLPRVVTPKRGLFACPQLHPALLRVPSRARK